VETKRIGVLGGMGPAATSELYRRIINFTDVKTDQEHVNLVILNNTNIPDRTNFILGNGKNPLPEMIKSIKELNGMKVSAIAIPCMTAHTFINELQEQSSVSVINAIKLVDEKLKKEYSTVENVALLATDGSIKSNVYQRFIDKNIIVPHNEKQREIMDVIYGKNGIKAGNNTIDLVERVNAVIEGMKNEGANVVIAGCTELGLILNDTNSVLPVIDPINLLANELIEIYQKEMGGKSNASIKFVQ